MAKKKIFESEFALASEGCADFGFFMAELEECKKEEQEQKKKKRSKKRYHVKRLT